MRLILLFIAVYLALMLPNCITAQTYLTAVPPMPVAQLRTDRIDVSAYPNPAIEEVRFDLSNVTNGNYTLKIYNIIGKIVWQQNMNVNGRKSIHTNLSNLRKGTYLYSLQDVNNRILVTKRLIIVRP